MSFRAPMRFLCAAALFLPPMLQAEDFPGGLIEYPDTAQARQALSGSEIDALLPERGPFTFPAPYNTEAVRLSSAADCGGADCVLPVGYAYWRNINSHAGFDTMLFFLGMDRNRGGDGPTLFEYDKSSGEVRKLGPIFGSDNHLSWSSGEGWYFSGTMPTGLYLLSGSRLLRHDVIGGSTETVLDVKDELGSGYRLWQASSSDDDKVHAATVRDDVTYEMLGCMAYRENTGVFDFFPKRGSFDECQVDKSGRWLVIKEDVDDTYGEDNRIIDLETGAERLLLDEEGAGGHSDMGHGYMVAADNFAAESNTWKLWKFDAASLTGLVTYYNGDWGAMAPAHVSHANATASATPESQYACGSSVSRSDSTHANEIVCFNLDGSGKTLVVAPVMTDLDSHPASDYHNMPKGNLDGTGRYFIWTSNMGGDRLDAFLVKVPAHLLVDGGVTDPSTDPVSEDPVALPEEPVAVTWTDMQKVKLNGTVLYKQGGCNGCGDAGAASVEEIGAEGGWFEFTVPASDLGELRYAGLTAHHAGTAADEIDFAVRLQGSYAEVRENGAYRSDTRYQPGDVFRVSVDGDTVTYARNGEVFYSSASRPAYPLRADTSFKSRGGAVESGMIKRGGLLVDSPDEPLEEPLSDAPVLPEPVQWSELINLSDSGGRLEKTGGCDGCSDAGAVSAQAIASGAGWFEFTVPSDDAGELRYAGLGGDAGTDGGAIDFAVRLQGGYAEVRENGAYRGDVSYEAGDVFRIALENGTVSYSRNGEVFHASALEPVYPLRAGAVFQNLGGAIVNGILYTPDK